MMSPWGNKMTVFLKFYLFDDCVMLQVSQGSCLSREHACCNKQMVDL